MSAQVSSVVASQEDDRNGSCFRMCHFWNTRRWAVSRYEVIVSTLQTLLGVIVFFVLGCWEKNTVDNKLIKL